MSLTIAAPLAVRKGFNFEILRSDGWFDAGDVLHVKQIASRDNGVLIATLTQIRNGAIIGESVHSTNAITANVVTGKWSNAKPYHYLADQDQLRVIYESNGDFNPAAICGNGAHPDALHTTRNHLSVSCAHCIKKLARYNLRK